MRVALSLIMSFFALHATAGSAPAWSEPGQVLGLPWGASVETVREGHPHGHSWNDTAVTAGYSTTTTVEGVALSVVFQFVSGHGLQGVMLRFPVNRLDHMVALFEREYARAPIRADRQWRWEGTGVRISLGEYPLLGAPGRFSGGKGIAWIRTRALEEAIARGEATPRIPQGLSALHPKSQPALSATSRPSYEERVTRMIYGALRYPTTTPGIYLVSLAFQLTAAGRPAALQLSVDPPNPEVAESVRTAVRRAQPFPPPPVAGGGSQDQPVTLTLTVSIFR